MATRRDQFRIEGDYWKLPLVRTANCGGVYPWAISVLAQTGNAATDKDLDPQICAAELEIPIEIAAAQLDGMKSVGLLYLGVDGKWHDFAWEDHRVPEEES